MAAFSRGMGCQAGWHYALLLLVWGGCAKTVDTRCRCLLRELVENYFTLLPVNFLATVAPPLLELSRLGAPFRTGLCLQGSQLGHNFCFVLMRTAGCQSSAPCPKLTICSRRWLPKNLHDAAVHDLTSPHVFVCR